MKDYISECIDFVLNRIIKWPLLLICLFFFKDILISFFTSLESIFIGSNFLLIIGALIFFLTGFSGNQKSLAGRFLTFEHEVSHAIFCFLTFKSNIRIDMNPHESWAAGMCRYTGGSNWLITLSPYFFPTLTIFFSALYLLPFSSIYPFLDVCIGYSIAYHLRTNYLELLGNSTSNAGDIQRAGKFFSFLIIPILNLIVFSIIFNLIS